MAEGAIITTKSGDKHEVTTKATTAVRYAKDQEDRLRQYDTEDGRVWINGDDIESIKEVK